MRSKVTLTTAFTLMVLLTLAWQADTAKGAGVITDGLLSYWSFDKDTIAGGTVKDLWGDRDATVTGGDPEIVEGRFGEALHFDGDDYLEYNPEGLPLKQEERTFGAWVRPEGAGVRAVLEWGTRSVGLRNSFLIESAERVKFCGESVDLLTGDSIPLEEWSLVTETYDGTTVRIYFDGELVSSEAKVLNTTIKGGPKQGFGRIGCNVEVAPGEFMRGSIDEASIYDRELGADEVKQNFEAGTLELAVSSSGKLVECLISNLTN